MRQEKPRPPGWRHTKIVARRALPLSRWHEYERRKATLREAGLTPHEYDQALREIIDELEL